ncbi:MAG: flagellar protein FlaG [Aquificaceae bacterium]|nr:flagellar protein FlaG [Aquificaceae bacterium]
MRVGNSDLMRDISLGLGYVGLTEKPNPREGQEDKGYVSVSDTGGNLKSVDSEELQKFIEEIKRKFDMLSKYLRIDIDRELEIPVVKIIERDTNRIIRQIPPEYLLELMKRIDQMLGVLLQKEV